MSMRNMCSALMDWESVPGLFGVRKGDGGAERSSRTDQRRNLI